MAGARANKIRKNDPHGLRRRVLDVAARRFQSAGYGGTSMHDVAGEAAVTGGALYHHFPTKKDLALAVIGERVSAEVAETWILPVQAAATAAAGVLSVFEATADVLEARGAVSGCPLNNLALELSLADPDFRAAVAAEYGSWRQAIAERLQRDLATGGAGFAAADPVAFADMVVAMFSGAMAIAKADQRATALRSCAFWLRRLMATDL